MTKIMIAAVLLLVLTSSCEFKAEVKTSDGSSKTVSKIRNGVTLKANNLTVSQAFLLFDDGTLVPENNEVKVGQPVKLRLIIDKGFTEQDGKAFPGASEKIETNDGQVVLDEKDLFAAYNEGVSKTHAGVISLTAEISRLDKLYDYFLVSFRVWDKKGNAEVSGNYKLYIK